MYQQTGCSQPGEVNEVVLFEEMYGGDRADPTQVSLQPVAEYRGLMKGQDG